MPAIAHTLPIVGSISDGEGGPQIVLAERLGGYDTFLTGVLEFHHRKIAVRIITLDDVTVLRPVDPSDLAEISGSCAGTLHLPHGARQRVVPADLADQAIRESRAIDRLDDAELRYALTFLEEATTDEIRLARIAAIVAALPPIEAFRSGEAKSDPAKWRQDRAHAT